MPSDPPRAFVHSRRSEPALPSRKPTTAEMVEANRGPGLVSIAGRTLLGIVAVAAVLLVLFLVATAIEGDDSIAPAPWAEQSAPAVTPGPLDVQ